MAVIGKVYDHKHTHELLKRHNWASRNPGVILVFCIVFLVVLGFFTLFIYRRMLRRNAEKQAFTG
jgi:predicted MFS family arabinose efflux permease